LSKKKFQVCEACGITSDETRVNFREKYNQVLCDKHYNHMVLYGKILEITRSDKNEYVLYDDYAEMILYNIKHEEVARAIIDLEDIELCKKYKWRLTKGYIKSGSGGKQAKQIQLHRYLLNVTNKNIKVDHKDKNPLNNRKLNLRICTQQENTCNQSLSIVNTSGVTGVNWTEKDKSWRAYITYKRKNIGLGYYKNKDDAIKARLIGEKKYFGEFAPQQHLYEQYGIV